MRIFVGGCSGVGKTTLLQSVKQKDLNIIHATSSFMLWLGIKNDYEALRKLPDPERERLLNQFMQELVSKSDSFVLDSHYSIMINGKVKNSINGWVKSMDAFVLITAPCEVIFKRIKNDSSRERALFPEFASEQDKLNLLQFFQDHLRAQSKELSYSLDKPYYELTNVDDIETSAEKLINFITSQNS